MDTTNIVTLPDDLPEAVAEQAKSIMMRTLVANAITSLSAGGFLVGEAFAFASHGAAHGSAEKRQQLFDFMDAAAALMDGAYADKPENADAKQALRLLLERARDTLALQEPVTFSDGVFVSDQAGAA